MTLLLSQLFVIQTYAYRFKKETPAVDHQTTFSNLTGSQDLRLTSSYILTRLLYFPIIYKSGDSVTPVPTPTPLDAPALLTPLTGAEHDLVTFEWTKVDRATSYHFQLATDAAFSNLVLDQTVIDSHYTLFLALHGLYYWRVYASAGTIPSDYSEQRPVYLIRLDSPTLLTPVVDASTTEAVTFAWTEVVSATAYILELSTASDFTTLVFSQTVSSSSFAYNHTLKGTFYWRVRATYKEFVSPYSEVRQVHLFALAPPTLLTPADGQAQAKLTFTWAEVISATSYQIQLAETPDFTATLVDQTVYTPHLTIAAPPPGLYYWRVQAFTGKTKSPRSEVWTVQMVSYYADADGDSLPNGWELHGYDHNGDQIIDVDLPALGVNYLHKDIFVEMDYMDNPALIYSLAPSQAVMDRIIAVFAQAPVSNPDNQDGITLHLDLDDLVPLPAYASYTIPWGTNGDVPLFYQYKNTYFETQRKPIYHYMIWANTYAYHTSTIPYTTGYSRRVPGEDFFVTLGTFDGGTDDEKVGAFIHELGHNLGLAHGGNNIDNYKPNYFSLMNYNWAVTGVPVDGEQRFDYQAFTLPGLNEYNLNEADGLNADELLAGYTVRYHCPGDSKHSPTGSAPADGPIDWNCDGDTTDTGLKANINGDKYDDGTLKYGYLSSQNDWSKIIFHGGNVIGP